MTPIKSAPWNTSSQPRFPGGEGWAEGVAISCNGVEVLED